MVDCFSRSDPALPPHERLAEGFSKAGHAITITTATSLTAFLIASSIDFPIISYFCFLGAMGILGVYVMQVRQRSMGGAQGLLKPWISCSGIKKAVVYD